MRSRETAPKDGSPFIGFFEGYPLPTMACWNEPSGKWVISAYQVEPVEGVWNDFYFENEWLDFESLKWWMELPEPKNHPIV